MKKLYIAFSLFLASLAYSQVPQAFSYQTIAFNSAGAPIANGNVNLRISILDNSATGNVLYTETHTKTTNSKGLVNLNIGQGTATTGNFGGINWGTNPKFVKVEMDPAGGSNYTNVGVNQLMSVPYSQVSKTVVTGPGQGITLVSPNGTNYTLNVDNSGNLNLPTNSSSNSTVPTNLYVYGTYNNFNASTAELMRNASTKYGYKYLPANTQLKFITAQNTSAQTYGVDSQNFLVINGNNINVSSNGFYRIAIIDYGTVANVKVENISPSIYISSNSSSSGITTSAITYNTSTNRFSVSISGVTSSNFNGMNITIPSNSGIQETLGDNLSDGNFDINGSYILIPNLTSTPKNFKLEFNINFDATGTYTITQI
ncbi:hypothetical protein [Epilithonimonas arachidiradicis]|uniref:Uncharacterized protein n=1 Tax=Epilithonimonas arachidiradicis TaxID=1617282 RepID=A0A420CXF0_9FLAO|nr:hypothetical protein [Epilithonimonas arachidiradicis]RKE83159.1 hypothetical protein BXY58_2711 [Epilithonimonas arachidiradicis]GGG65379.1 hypothetical protein GCM10007332_29850 [Epilithonimonas arachidiradicis]